MSDPVKIDLGTRLICEDKEFIVINYSLIRDHAGYLLRFEANDPLIALTRQMEQERAKEDREKQLKHVEQALGLMGRVEQELDQGEEWKRKGEER